MTRNFHSFLLGLSILALFFLSPTQTIKSDPIGAYKDISLNINPLKVITYNIHYGTNANGQLTIDHISDFLASSEADIICLQEVDHLTLRGHLKDQSAVLKEALSMESAYAITSSIFPGKTGNLILSRYPIVSTSELKLPSSKYPRAALKAIIETPYGNISIVNTHLGLSKSIRQKQFESLFQWIQEEQYPLLITGDFNTSDSNELSLLSSSFVDTALITNQQNINTFENEKYNSRIDYIFASTNFFVYDYNVMELDISDHYPVVVNVVPRQ